MRSRTQHKDVVNPANMKVHELKDRLRKTGIIFPEWAKRPRLIAILKKSILKDNGQRPLGRTRSVRTLSRQPVDNQARDESLDQECDMDPCDLIVDRPRPATARSRSRATASATTTSGSGARSTGTSTTSWPRPSTTEPRPPCTPAESGLATDSTGLIPETWNNFCVTDSQIEPLREDNAPSLAGIVGEMRALVAEQKQLMTDSGAVSAHARGTLPANPRCQQWPMSSSIQMPQLPQAQNVPMYTLSSAMEKVRQKSTTMCGNYACGINHAAASHNVCVGVSRSSSDIPTANISSVP